MSDNTVAINRNENPEEPEKAIDLYAVAAFNVMAALRKSVQREAAEISDDGDDPFLMDKHMREILSRIEGFIHKRSLLPHQLADRYLEHEFPIHVAKS